MTKEIKPYLHEGENKKIAFVFSAPGQKESQENKPVSGQTGDNLEILLNLLGIKRKDRYDFTITNSYTGVLYQAKDGITEAPKSELIKKENIDRLRDELKDVTDYIIFFGENAQSVAYLLCDLKARFIFSRHLGLQSLNQIENDIDGNRLEVGGEENTKKRLEVVARFIRKQMRD